MCAPLAQMVKKALERRLLCEDGEVEWWVEKLAKPMYPGDGTSTDARVAKYARDGRRLGAVEPWPSWRGSRVDLRIKVPPLGGDKYLWFHRVVCLAWHGDRHQDKGGKWVRRKTKWPAANLHVDHGGRPPSCVRIGSLMFCTPARNWELQKERKEGWA